MNKVRYRFRNLFRHPKYLGLFSFLLFFTYASFGQTSDHNDVKVGLVLSGGGAKGLAHIGALKVIEETGVRIDYIGGTSMGAIIGGLYASGYSAHQLDSIFSETDFSILIQDEIPRRTKSFHEKLDAEKYSLVLPFDNFKLGLPSGLSRGQNLYNLLAKLTAHIGNVEDFSKLPIPFFCVATNVETGEEVILDKGYLPRAIMASGALPSLFNPVIIDDTVMIDGGVVNNYPVKEVRKKGMDKIIGVDVQDSLKSREDLQSAFRILMQINNFNTIFAMYNKKEETDIYMHPDIKDFSVVSFVEGRKIIDAGVESAEKFREEMTALAAQQKKQVKKEVQFVKQDSINIKEVVIEGNTNYTRSYILGKLRLRAPEKISYEEFGEGVNALSATGNFRSVSYRFYGDEDEGTKLVFNVQENPSRLQLRFGAHFDNLFKSAILVNLNRKRILTNNDVASLDLIVGDNLRYNFNYYIDKGYYWSLGLNSRYHFFETKVPLGFLSDDGPMETSRPLNKISLNYSDFTNQIYFETILRRTFVFGVGAEHKYLRYLTETIGVEQNEQRTVFESTNYYSAYGFLKYDSYDNSFFPTKGVLLSGDFHWYLMAEGRNKDFEPFSIAKAQLGYAFSPLPRFAVHYQAAGGFKVGRSGSTPLDFGLGGYGFKEMNNIIPFYGYRQLSLRGNTYLKSTLTLDYQFIRNNHLNAAFNIANVGNDLFAHGDWIKKIDYYGFAFGYGLETLLGPMEVKYAYSPESKESEWYISLGYRF